MAVVAIDPGTANTGLVWMERGRVIEAETVSIKGAVRGDQEALRIRAEEVARRVAAFMEGKEREAVVIEGFIGYPGRQGGYAYQTPYLVGYLHRALEGERLVTQTSRQVLNPRTRGNKARMMDALRKGRCPIEGAELLTNDHLRSAACHGAYYFDNERKER